MNNKNRLVVVILLVAGLACGIPTSLTSEPEPTDCDLTKWNLFVASIEEKDLGDGKKRVIARVGLENNDLLWGRVYGPQSTESSVSLTTEDGVIVKALDGFLPSETFGETVYENTGEVQTVGLPPGFVTRGKTFVGKPYLFNFAFEIPVSQKPKSITVEDLKLTCIYSAKVGEDGQVRRGEGRRNLPTQTLDVNADLGKVRHGPSAKKFPNLIGSTIELYDGAGLIEFTKIERGANLVIITFNFTNLKSTEDSVPSDLYLIGHRQLASCLMFQESDCEHQGHHISVQPGQTAEGLTWLFNVPLDETDLLLVHVEERIVFRLDP